MSNIQHSEDCDNSYETERDSALISVKNKLNSIARHHASVLLKDNDSGLEQTDLVSDVNLAKNNIAPSIYASAGSHDNYGQQFSQIPTTRAEKQYQIKLLTIPDRNRLYVGELEAVDPRQTELMTMFLMIIMVVVIAMIIHLMMVNTASVDEEDPLIVYKITAHKVNSDPVLSQFRSMSI